MSKNMSMVDRGARAVIAGGALAAAVVVGAGSAGGIVLLVAAAVMAATASVGVCPLYALFRFDSRGRTPLPH